MKIIFSRKGFDSEAGGTPSPIVNNCPISLPIPGWDEPYTYGDLSHPLAGPLAPLVEKATKGTLSAASPAHADPVLPWTNSQAILGQSGAAASHLIKQGVDVGDVFVFFGLFEGEGWKPHHRIFGMMRVERVASLASTGGDWKTLGLNAPHPHTERLEQATPNTLYIGTGKLAHCAHPALCLSQTPGLPSLWRIPYWLKKSGLSYHGNLDRWTDTTLKLVNRGQDFVANPGSDQGAKRWLLDLSTLMDYPHDHPHTRNPALVRL